MTATMNALDFDALAMRHHGVLRASGRKALRLPIMLVCLGIYLVFSWWFFSVGTIIGNANWRIAGTYLASWVSYEVRPEFRVSERGTMTLSYGRGPLGSDPHPDWVSLKTEQRTVGAAPVPAVASSASKPKTGLSFMVPDTPSADPAARQAVLPEMNETIVTHATVTLDSSSALVIEPQLVTARKGTEELSIRLSGQGAQPETPLPSWAEQKRPGEKIVLSFGATGWAEITGDRVTVRNRFFGWANFLFDTNSPYFGKPYGEVLSLIVSGERLDPSRSNLALAWNNICYNAEWQHLDVWTKLLQTIVMAFVGTLFASLVAFPLSFVAARTITRSGVLNQTVKRFFDFLRSVDMFIWALFFTRAFGPGPLAGMAAIFFTDTGTLGKLYSEALENIDDRQREGIRSVGASPLSVQRYGVLPQVLPVFASQALYFWESNTRSATIIGAVGAGGIGLKLWEAIRTNSNWANVAYMVLLLLIVVFVFDAISNALRSRLINRNPA
jgi:phosphonate transport system permease protein